MSKEEFKDFWENKVPELKDLILNNHCSYPEISARYLDLRRQIIKRYSKPTDVEICINYNPLGKNIIAGSIVKDKGPKFGVFIPALRDVYNFRQQEQKEGWEEGFHNLALVSVLHELDHLASGYIITPEKHDTSFDAKMDREKHAWALTCEYTIEPMIKRGAKIDDSDMQRYNAWVEAGRNVDSPLWDEAIRGIHIRGGLKKQ